MARVLHAICRSVRVLSGTDASIRRREDAVEERQVRDGRARPDGWRTDRIRARGTGRSI